jgi:hypothetical protein
MYCCGWLEYLAKSSWHYLFLAKAIFSVGRCASFAGQVFAYGFDGVALIDVTVMAKICQAK